MNCTSWHSLTVKYLTSLSPIILICTCLIALEWQPAIPVSLTSSFYKFAIVWEPILLLSPFNASFTWLRHISIYLNWYKTIPHFIATDNGCISMGLLALCMFHCYICLPIFVCYKQSVCVQTFLKLFYLKKTNSVRTV